MPQSPTSHDLPPGVPSVGDVIGGKYVMERLLGIGGMGVVFAARHRHLDERVAIKLLLPSMATDATFVARFVREAKAASRIRGEHVARVIDVTTDGGAPYLVMELLDGRDLSEVLAERGTLRVDESVDYVLEVCQALAEAHAKGIIHRDLKPSNLFLARRPDGTSILKVVDFGISKFVSVDGVEPTVDMSMTQTSTVLGSPYYMSPEQLKASKAMDARTDIWSLGVIFYELLTGACPFDGDTFAELSASILMVPAPSLSSKRPDLPVGLDGIMQRWLAKKPADRFASVGELARSLASYGGPTALAARDRILRTSDEHTSDRRVGLPTPPPSSVVVDGESSPHAATLAATTGPGTGAISQTGSETAQAASPRRWLAPVIGVVVLAGAVGGAVALRSPPSPGAPIAATEPPNTEPAPTASSRTAHVGVSAPLDATVEVDGRRVEIASGGVEVRGVLGSVHPLRVAAGGREMRAEIAITETGAVPSRVELSGAAEEPPSTRASASAAPPRVTGVPAGAKTTKTSSGPAKTGGTQEPSGTPKIDREF